MKRFLSAILVLAISAGLMATAITASADEVLDTPSRNVMEQIHFDTLLEFEQYLTNLQKTGDSGVITKNGRAATYMKTLDTLYCPKGLGLGRVVNLSVSSEWIAVRFSNKVTLYYYHDAAAAKRQLDDAKKYVADKKLTSAQSKKVGDHTVYTYDAMYNSRCYAWSQDGKVFELYVDFTPEPQHFSRCIAVGENIFAENDRSEVQGITEIDGKIYFILPNGTHLKGWHSMKNGDTYFFRSKDGSAITGNATISGKKYVFNDDGTLNRRATIAVQPVEQGEVTSQTES